MPVVRRGRRSLEDEEELARWEAAAATAAGAERFCPKTTAAWACSRAAVRASGVFGIGGAGSGGWVCEVFGALGGGTGESSCGDEDMD
jgi:hypothetical protein